MSNRIHPTLGRASLPSALGAAIALGALVPACGSETKPNPKPNDTPVVVTPPPYGAAYKKLSDWHLYRDAKTQTAADKVIPYDVISPLFTDYTTKFRFLWVPDGAQIGYADDSPWAFPVGTILVKTFTFHTDYRDPSSPLSLLETRILWHEPDGWTVHTYQWRADGTDADSVEVGATIPTDFIDATGASVHDDYYIPNTNECKECHTNSMVVGPIGTRTRQLDRQHDFGKQGGALNQIDHLDALGMFSATPTSQPSRTRLVDPFGDADLDTRVRSYLDANCSSCHAKGGYASQSSLLLDFPSTDPKNPANTEANWGVCKVPTSQGGATCNNTYDIVPGKPDASILMCRFTTTEAKWRMPPLGVQLLHKEGIDLIRQWISAMPPGICSN